MTDPYRTPGRVDQPTEFKPCARCKQPMHPLQNARGVGGEIWCMPCYEALFTTIRPRR